MRRLLVVGGGSRSGLAFRKLASKEGRAVTVLARDQLATHPNERLLIVEDYFAPPAGAFDDHPVVVNFAGAPAQPTEAGLWRLNAEGPAALAGLARASGATEFVQLSSLSIYGGAEDIDLSTPPSPDGLYGRTKLSAEEALARLRDPNFLIVILRAPMIYGPDGGGKLAQLIRLLNRTRVLPVPTDLAVRSMVHVDNLAMAIMECIDQGGSRTAFTADHDPFDLSKLADAFHAEGRPARLIKLPPAAFLPLKIGPGRRVFESLFGRSYIAPGPDTLPQRQVMDLSSGLRALVRSELTRCQSP